MGLGRTQSASFFVCKGIGLLSFMGLFHTLILPPPIAPQIFTLVKERDLTKIVEKCISPFNRSNRTWLDIFWLVHLTRKILFGPLLQNLDGNKSFSSMEQKSIISSRFGFETGRRGSQ
jgi:hypothetical protein